MYDRMLKALLLEISSRQSLLQNRRVVSIYFGGGTPYLFGPQRLEKILTHLASVCTFYDPEITLEANPDSLQQVKEYSSIGVNRWSVGVQSLDDSSLCFLERMHDSQAAVRAVYALADSGVTNISIDLMYDLPNQTLCSWKDTLTRALTLPVTHISSYNLVLEPKTAFYARKDEISSCMPRAEESLAQYRALQQETQKSGFEQYEISAFCRPHFRSQHNCGYWTGREFLGFGPSAFSFYAGRRFSNISNVFRYCEFIESGKSAVDFVDDVSLIERLREMIAIGLRMNEGIDLSKIEARWGKSDAKLQATLHHLHEIGLLTKVDNRIALTEEGRVLYDSIAVEII
jgi:oxygen-independent coproporphyrinogen-3 oxidase